MTGPHDQDGAEGAATRPISVAELLAKNGTIGSPSVTTRRRRRRGNSDAVTVAELTGEIPVIRDDDEPPSQSNAPDPAPPADEPAPAPAEAMHWDEPGPRWPESPKHVTPTPDAGPQLSAYPRPMRKADLSDAELMRPDPVDNFTDIEVDVMDTEVSEVEPPAEDSAYVRSFLRGPRSFFGKRRDAAAPVADDDAADLGEVLGDGYPPSDDYPVGDSSADLPDLESPLDADLDEALDEDLDEALDAGLDEAFGEDSDEDLDEPDGADLAGPDRDDAGLSGLDESVAAREDDDDIAVEDDVAGEEQHESLGAAVLRGGLVVLQSILAVAFGAGLFIAFDRLWEWNNIVALVLSVLVTLGLVAAVQVVRKTVDTTSTLIAVAVGLLITLGPLALLRSG